MLENKQDIGILMGEKDFAFFQLLRDGFLGTAIFGIESLIIAISTTAITFGTIPIRTGEPGIERYFLYLIRKITSQEERKLII